MSSDRTRGLDLVASVQNLIEFCYDQSIQDYGLGFFCLLGPVGDRGLLLMLSIREPLRPVVLMKVSYR